MQGAKTIDINVGDNFIYLAAQIGSFTHYRIAAMAFFEHQNKGEKIN